MPIFQATIKGDPEVLFTMPDAASCYKQLLLTAKAAGATQCLVEFNNQGAQVTAHLNSHKITYLVAPYVKPAKQPSAGQPRAARPSNPANPLAWRGKPSADGWLAVNTATADLPSLDHLTPPTRPNLAAQKAGILAPPIKPTFSRWQMACITVPLNGDGTVTQHLGDVLQQPKAARINGCVAAAKQLVVASAYPAAQYLVGRDATNSGWVVLAKRYSGLEV